MRTVKVVGEKRWALLTKEGELILAKKAWWPRQRMSGQQEEGEHVVRVTLTYEAPK